MLPLPTLIFCHGSWHTPEYFKTVKEALESEGYRCLAPNIIYNGDQEPVQSMTAVIAALQEVIAAETALGHNVVMVNHSMGGMAGTSAIKGFTKKNASRLESEQSGHVVGLVQLTTWTPTADEISVAGIAHDFARRNPNFGFPPAIAEDDGQGWWKLRGDPAQYFYGDMSHEEGRKWVTKLINFSSAIRTASDSVYAGWRDVPMWYLVCTRDMAIQKELQEDMVQQCIEAGAGIMIRECEAGHSPMLSKPAETITFIEDAVKAFGA